MTLCFPTYGKHVGCAEQVLTVKSMKKLCFSLVWHGKTWKNGGLSRLGGCVITPTCFPGAGTSFLRFFKSLKILIFLNRKFHHGIFHLLMKNLPGTNICDYNRESYWNWFISRDSLVLIRNFKLMKIPWWKFNYIFSKYGKCVYYIRNNVPASGKQI